MDTPLGTIHDNSEIDGLLKFRVHAFPGDFFRSTIYGRFSFTTDSDRNIVSWSSDYADGPPDGGISSTEGDIWSAYHDYWTAPPGTWSEPRVIPIPGTLYLSAPIALGFAFLFRNRRKPAGSIR